MSNSTQSQSQNPHPHHHRHSHHNATSTLHQTASSRGNHSLYHAASSSPHLHSGTADSLSSAPYRRTYQLKHKIASETEVSPDADIDMIESSESDADSSAPRPDAVAESPEDVSMEEPAKSVTSPLPIALTPTLFGFSIPPHVHKKLIALKEEALKPVAHGILLLFALVVGLLCAALIVLSFMYFFRR